MSTSVNLIHAQAATPCSECKKRVSSHIPCKNCEFTLSKDDTEALMTYTSDTEPTSLKCTDHNDPASCYCEKCETAVCIRCVTGNHQGHKMVDFEEIFQREKQLLQIKIDRIQNDILPNLIKLKKEVNSNYQQNEISIQQIVKDMEDEKISFQNEIDRIHHKRMKVLAGIRDSDSEILKGFSKDMEKEITFYESKLTDYREDYERKSVKEIIEVKKQVEPLPQIVRMLEQPKPKFQDPPVFISAKIHSCEDNLGKLHIPCSLSTDSKSTSRRSIFTFKKSFTFLCASLAVCFAFFINQKQLFSSTSPVANVQSIESKYRSPIKELSTQHAFPISTTPTVVSTYKSPFTDMPFLSLITKEGDVWLGGGFSSELVMVDIKGQILRRLNMKVEPLALAALDNGDIINCSFHPYGSCYVIRFIKDDREQNVFQIDLSDEIGVGVSVTSNQEILICTLEGRVVITKKYGSSVREIYIGSKHLSVKHAVESTDGNIYISDADKSAVVIVNKDGYVLSTLTHTTDGQGLGEPRGMVVDVMGNVLLAGWSDNTIYIIDKNQQVKKLLGDEDGIKHPLWLAVDNDNNLWIQQGDGTIHVVKYLSL